MATEQPLQGAGPQGDARANPTRGLGKILVVLGLAFLVTFSLVPLYRIACEKVFGIRLEQSPSVPRTAAAAGVAPAARMVTVEFDGGVNSRLPWEFRPDQRRMQVQVGRQYEATYTARNVGRGTVVGNAVPSVAPARGSKFFAKTECFCFTEQQLAAGESKVMPVRFIVDPALPADISTLTLSYTFYQNDSRTEAARASAGAHAAAVSAP